MKIPIKNRPDRLDKAMLMEIVRPKEHKQMKRNVWKKKRGGIAENIHFVYVHQLDSKDDADLITSQPEAS